MPVLLLEFFLLPYRLCIRPESQNSSTDRGMPSLFRNRLSDSFSQPMSPASGDVLEWA